jgi:hypothetical protein
LTGISFIGEKNNEKDQKEFFSGSPVLVDAASGMDLRQPGIGLAGHLGR